MPHHAAAVQLSDLSAGYPAHGASPRCTVLHGIDLRIARGEVVGMLGSTGSGKSTLADLLSGAARVERRGRVVPRLTGGDGAVLGYALKGLSGREAARLTFSVGYLRQDAGTHLDPTLTAAENITAPIYARDRHFSRKIAGERAAKLMEEVQLPLGALTKFPFELSAGQRQRVALATALVLGPSLLIADQPVRGIDPTVRDAVIEVIGDLRRQDGFSALIISHDLALLRRLTSTVVVLHDGSIVAIGPIDAVLEDPRHPYVATLATQLLTPNERGTIQ